MVDGLRQVDINEPVLWVTTGIEERDAHDTIRRDGYLWLELVGTILQKIVIDTQGF